MKAVARIKIVYYHFDSKHKWSSLLLISVITKIFVSVQNINFHVTVGKSGLGTKLNVIRFQI